MSIYCFANFSVETLSFHQLGDGSKSLEIAIFQIPILDMYFDSTLKTRAVHIKHTGLLKTARSTASEKNTLGKKKVQKIIFFSFQ